MDHISLFSFLEGCILPDLYKLTCLCGLSISVGTNQAGRQIDCSCGQQLQVPALSGILNLEPVPGQETRKSEKAKLPKSPASRSIQAKQVVLLIGMVAFIVTSLIFVLSARKYPQLHDVCLMQRLYVHDGKLIGRDTQPISTRDFRLLVDERIVRGRYLVWTEDVFNHLPYIDEHPIILVEMHDYFKGGLEFSYNFNEKYEKIVFNYWARFVVFGVLAIVSLVVLIVGIMLPKQTNEIGERGGENWE